MLFLIMEDRKWQICLQKLHCSLAVLLLLNFSAVVATTELLVEVPKSLTIAVNSSAIFTCRSIANTEITWSITGKKFSSLGFDNLALISFLNSSGITLLESNQSDVSAVRVEGIPDNNGTKLVCTAIRMQGAAIDQSGEALLILYGPPNPPTDIRISAPSSFMLQLNWNEPFFAFESVPFTYTLFIQNENDFFASDIQLEQNETEYLFVANESDACQNFSFVLRSMNDAGYGNESETITSAVPNVPGQISNVHTRVYFTEDGDAELLLRFAAPEVCQCYPILLYSVKLTDITNERGSLEINETFDNLNSTNDDGFVELIVSGQLISDRRYMVSVSAENEVGSHPDLESREIYTTDLQDVNVTLIENNLTIVCVFAEGSNSRGCLVRLTNFNLTFPILRNGTQDLVSSVIPINGLQLPDSTNLEILVSDYESDESYGNLSWNFTVTVTIPTSTTQTTRMIPSTTTSITMTTSTAGTPRPSNMGADRQGSVITQTTLVIISAGVLAGLVLVSLVFVAMAVALRKCIGKNKRKTTVQPSDKERPYTEVGIQNNDNVENGIIPRSNSESMVEPYVVTSLIHPMAVKPKEPLYQELKDVVQPVHAPLTAQNSSTPLLSSTQSNSPPPPLPPPLPPLPINGTTNPIYHVLEENAGNSQSSTDSQVTPPLYDEVIRERPESSLPSDKLSSSRSTLRTPTPVKGHIYHILDPNLNHGNEDMNSQSSQTFNSQSPSNSQTFNSQSTISTMCSTLQRNGTIYDDVFEDTDGPRMFLSPQNRFNYTRQASVNGNINMIRQARNHELTLSLPMSNSLGTRGRCNSEPGNTLYDTLDRHQPGKNWTPKRTLV